MSSDSVTCCRARLSVHFIFSLYTEFIFLLQSRFGSGFKRRLNLHLTKSWAQSRVSVWTLHLIKGNRQINECCCLLDWTQLTSITSTTEYIKPPAVYIQHLGNHWCAQSHRPTAAGRSATPLTSSRTRTRIRSELGFHHLTDRQHHLIISQSQLNETL